jgi:hypothetical protein
MNSQIGLAPHLTFASLYISRILTARPSDVLPYKLIHTCTPYCTYGHTYAHHPPLFVQLEPDGTHGLKTTSITITSPHICANRTRDRQPTDPSPSSKSKRKFEMYASGHLIHIRPHPHPIYKTANIHKTPTYQTPFLSPLPGLFLDRSLKPNYQKKRKEKKSLRVHRLPPGIVRTALVYHEPLALLQACPAL